MPLTSKSYKVTLPSGSYTEDDVRQIESWSLDNCCCAAIAKTNGEHVVWVARREKTRSKGEWMRHVRGVFNTLRLNARLAGDNWLELCAEQEACEIIRNAGGTTRQESRPENDAAQDGDTRDILMPSAARAAVRPSRARTSVEIVKTA